MCDTEFRTSGSLIPKPPQQRPPARSALLTAGTNRRKRLAIALPLQAAYSQDMEVLTSAKIARMSPPERLALIAELWNSLGDQPLLLSDAHRAELQRRLDSLDQDRTKVVAWADLQAELAARCP